MTKPLGTWLHKNLYHLTFYGATVYRELGRGAIVIDVEAIKGRTPFPQMLCDNAAVYTAEACLSRDEVELKRKVRDYDPNTEVVVCFRQGGLREVLRVTSVAAPLRDLSRVSSRKHLGDSLR